MALENNYYFVRIVDIYAYNNIMVLYRCMSDLRY